MGDLRKLQSAMTRWKLDPRQKTETYVKPFKAIEISGEFARIDDRFVTKYYKHFFFCIRDGTKFFDAEKCAAPRLGFFNCLGRVNWETGEKDVWWAGPTSTVQEPVFCPRSKDAEEGDGYLIALVDRLDVLRNDLVIFDTAQGFEKGPVAVIKLPLKLKSGLHGNWVPYEDIQEWRERTGDNKKYEMRKMPEPMRNSPTGFAHTNGVNGDSVNGVNGR